MRLTRYDPETGEYVLIRAIDKKTLLDTLGRLEDYRDNSKPQTYADYIRTLRKQRNMSQEEFAKLVHLPRNIIANYESHRNKPSSDFWKRLYLYADISLSKAAMIYAKAMYNIDEFDYNELSSPYASYERKKQLAGLFLRSEREFYKLTKQEIARKLGITSNIYTKYEAGKYELTWAHCNSFADVIKTAGGDPANILTLGAILREQRLMNVFSIARDNPNCPAAQVLKSLGNTKDLIQ